MAAVAGEEEDLVEIVEEPLDPARYTDHVRSASAGPSRRSRGPRATPSRGSAWWSSATRRTPPWRPARSGPSARRRGGGGAWWAWRWATASGRSPPGRRACTWPRRRSTARRRWRRAGS
ncbi:putative molybdopterin synthase catalytic subunit [Iris pallida]|uniref:Molybdopterin synthase catalytic subunit n=1 Tax=Iris pallida TaxID=29817 RepID=A0AAX6IK57_IRIPA|nr:putative molybdopterin synthase catalytic subunit [Iris pallida]